MANPNVYVQITYGEGESTKDYRFTLKPEHLIKFEVWMQKIKESTD